VTNYQDLRRRPARIVEEPLPDSPLIDEGTIVETDVPKNTRILRFPMERCGRRRKET
jgi:hypothetical protein